MTIHVTSRAVAASVALHARDLVRELDDEPRIPDLVLGSRLGFAKPHNVRKLIDRNRAELQSHGALVERPSTFLHRGEKSAGRTGRPGIMWFLNEGQALVICSLARTPVAARVRTDIIAVYMAHRRDVTGPAPSERERRALSAICRHGHVWPAGEAGGVATLEAPVTDDILDALAAFDAEEAEPDADEEPILAAPERLHGGSQLDWAAGSDADREQDGGDEGEAGEDEDCDLGGTNPDPDDPETLAHWSRGAGSSDTGLGDPEGAAEQAGGVLTAAERAANREGARAALARLDEIESRRDGRAPHDPYGICNVGGPRSGSLRKRGQDFEPFGPWTEGLPAGWAHRIRTV